MRSPSALLATFGTLTVLLGCASNPTPEVGTDEGATVIEPNGTDSPGKLVVSLPYGAVEPTKATWRNVSQPAGQAIDQVPVGDQDFTLQSGFITMRGRANIKAGQLTTVQAAIVSIDAMTGPRTLGLAKDPSAWAVQLSTLDRGSVGSVSPTSNGATGLGILAGAYEVRFGVGGNDGVPVTLAAGESKKSVLTDTTARRVVRIQAPTRDMPTANCGGADGKTYRISIPGGDHSDADMPDGASLDVGTAPSRGNVNYQLTSSVWREAVPLPVLAAGQGPITWAMGRVDIDDVLINNTLPRVPGTYQIWRTDAAGNRGVQMLQCAPKTKTGVDLPPGKYRVEVTYKTVEAGDKIDVHMFEVP